MRHNKKKIKNYRSIFKLTKSSIIWFLVLITLTAHVFLAVQTSSVGVDISFIEDEINKLEKENEEISIKLVNSTSLTKLNKVSEEMGFGEIENTLYLGQIDSFAKAQ